MAAGKKYLALLLLVSGCATAAQKGVSPLTADGIKERTGVILPAEYQKASEGKIQLPPGVQLDRPLSSDDAAAIALWNNPQFSADLSMLGIFRGDLIDAGQLRNPRLDILFPMGLKPFELLLNLPLEMIWERPARVAAAENAYGQYAQSLIQNGLSTVQDARLAHANLMLAKKREHILAQASELRQRISKINTHQRLRTGEVTEAEGIATEVDFVSSEELWMRARHDTYVASERLKFSLGLIFERQSLEIAESQVLVFEPAPVEILVQNALRRRPDLKAAEIGVRAAAERANWEAARIAQLSLLLSTKGIGTNGILTGPGLSAEIPLFHRNDGRRERADAEVELATRQFLALKQRVAFEVREARELLLQAQEVLLRTREKVLPLLEKSVRIAEKEYRRRASSYLFVLEQTRSLVDAQLRVADFETAVVRAEAQLSRAVGGRP